MLETFAKEHIENGVFVSVLEIGYGSHIGADL